MLKKLSLVALLGAASLGLVACDGDKSVSTGVAECDQYITALNKMTKDMPNDQKAGYNTMLEQITKAAKDSPEEAKTQCKAALDSIPSQFR